MQLKWKIYYWCSVYLALWSISMTCLIIYGIGAAHLRGNNVVVLPFSLSVLLIVLSNSIVSIRFVTIIKKGGRYTKNERLLFNILYGLMFVLTIFSFILSATELPQTIKRAHSNAGIETALEVGLILATLAGIYFCIMASALIKAIDKNHHSAVDQIGEHLHP